MRRAVVLLACLTGCGTLLNAADYTGGSEDDAGCVGPCTDASSTDASAGEADSGSGGKGSGPEDSGVEDAGPDADSATPNVDAGCTKFGAVVGARAMTAVSLADGSSTAWSSPTKALAQDGVPATVSLGAGKSSQELFVSNFGITLPAAAKEIRGITVVVTRASTSGQITDTAVRLFVDGAPRPGGVSAPPAWPTSFAPAKYGSVSDTWGAGLTVADVTRVDFGVGFGAKSGGADTARIDDVTVTIDFCE